jgi:polyhydroxybutyrate depolymerase
MARLAAVVVVVGCSRGTSERSSQADASFAMADAGRPREDASGCVGCGSDGGKDPPSEGGVGRDGGPTLTKLAGGHMVGVPIAVTTATGVVMRTYDITLPDSCDSAHPLPVVFAFHGDGSSGAGMYATFPIEVAARGAGGSAVFVYPNGTNMNVDPGGVPRAWDLYHDPGPFPYAYTVEQPAPAEPDEPTGNVDVDFFDAMVALFERRYCVDRSRVFTTGMSSGGYLSNQLARWRSGVVRATAPQSGGAPFGNTDSVGAWTAPNYCIGSTGKVAALIIHGLADTTVDPCNAVEAESYWQLTNGCAQSANNCTTTPDACTGSNLAAPPPAPTTTSALSAFCRQTSGCGAAPVVYCPVPGLGHEIWSDAPSVVWSFLSSL